MLVARRLLIYQHTHTQKRANSVYRQRGKPKEFDYFLPPFFPNLCDFLCVTKFSILSFSFCLFVSFPSDDIVLFFNQEPKKSA